jgi:hypothetical protein
MLNKILAKLNGHATDVDALIAALADIGRERVTAKSELSELQVRRHQALLDDATDATLDKLERDIVRKETTLEKLELAEPGVRQRIAAAQAGARQRRWHALHETYVAAAGEFLVAARVTVEKHTTMIAAVEQAQREGFAGEVAAAIPATPAINGQPLLAPDLLNIFERAILPPSTRRAAAPVPKKAAPHPAGERPQGSMQHGISDALGVPTPIENLTSKRMRDDLSPLAPGESRVIVLRHGWSPRDDRPATHTGQQIKMPLAEARAAANKGLVEIVEMNVDRTQAQGADWQGTDPHSITFLGSGGTSMTQRASPPAASAVNPNEGAAK